MNLSGQVTHQLAIALNARAVELGGEDFRTGNPIMSELGVTRFFVRAGFDSETLYSWCEKDSTVDVPSVINMADHIRQIGSFGSSNPLYTSALVGQSRDDAILNFFVSDRFVETVFFSTIIQIRSNRSFSFDWDSMDVIARNYHYDAASEMFNGGLRLPFIADRARDGMDAELALSMISSNS